MAFFTGKTVPTVIDIALLAQTALGATLQLFVAGTALVTVCKQATVRAGAVGAARAAQTAAILIPVVVAAEPAFHTVLVSGKHRCWQQANQYYDAKQDRQKSFYNYVFHYRISLQAFFFNLSKTGAIPIPTQIHTKAMPA